WINRVALNTGTFTDTSSALLDDDEIRSAVANRAVDELFANVDVQAEVEEQLPKDYKGLSGAATAGLRQASYQIVDRALEQPVFQDLFRVALEESHTTLVEVLEGGGDRVSTNEGEVTLDLRAIIIEAADRIGIGEQVVDRIPADAGQIVVLRSDELDTAQDVFQLLKTLAWVLPLLTLVAFGLAVWLSGDRRRAIRGIGWVVVVVGLLGLVAARLTKNYVVDSLVERRDDRQAAGNAWDILTELMRGSFRLMVVVGLLFVLAAWLAGPGRRALTVRGWLAPGLQSRAWAYVVLAVLGLLLLFTASMVDFTRLLVVALLVALGATWIEVTRRQTLREFPDAQGTAFLADTWERLSNWWDRQWAAITQPSTTPPSPRVEPAVSPVAPATDVASRLTALSELHARGALSDEEFASAKARVLAGD
ncbi:MAG TPA: SHOCT domain-containing protein, partial [Gaiellaceae bacterium]|nr:SHOCT domain-containing protein [Gaiellaceae bacterium]